MVNCTFPNFKKTSMIYKMGLQNMYNKNTNVWRSCHNSRGKRSTFMIPSLFNLWKGSSIFGHPLSMSPKTHWGFSKDGVTLFFYGSILIKNTGVNLLFLNRRHRNVSTKLSTQTESYRVLVLSVRCRTIRHRWYPLLCMS